MNSELLSGEASTGPAGFAYGVGGLLRSDGVGGQVNFVDLAMQMERVGCNGAAQYSVGPPRILGGPTAFGSPRFSSVTTLGPKR